MEEVVGRNPRFMQDPQADRGAVVEMGQAIKEGRATVVEVINVRKDGSRFWNQVSLPAQLCEPLTMLQLGLTIAQLGICQMSF